MVLLVICITLIGFAGFVIGFRWQLAASLVSFGLYCFWFLFKNAYRPTVAMFEKGIDNTESAPEVFAVALLTAAFTVPCVLIGWKLSHLFRTITGVIDKVLGVIFGGILGFVLFAIYGGIISLASAILFAVIVVFVDVNKFTGGSSFRRWRSRHRVKRLKRRNRPGSVGKGGEDRESRGSEKKSRRKHRQRPRWGRGSRRRKDN